MTAHPHLIERVREALAGLPDVKEKRMFGGVAFMVNDKMCVTVGNHEDHQMMVRVGPAAYESAIQKTGARPAIMGGRTYKGYVFLVAAAVQTKRQLSNWVALALDFNRQLTGARR